MDIALWIVQGLLAAVFAAAGIMKVTQPIARLSESMEWVNRFSESTVRFIGFAEMTGAMVIILPWAMNIYPVLTPLSACGFGLIMILAFKHHAENKEKIFMAVNLVILCLCVFVACGRFSSL